MRQILIIFSILLVATPAVTAAASRTHVLVIFADHLTWSDVGSFASLPPGASNVVYGLISPGRPLGPDPMASIYATLGAGDSIAAGEVSEGLLGRALWAAGRTTAVVGDTNGLLHFLPDPDGRLAMLTPGALARYDLVAVDADDLPGLRACIDALAAHPPPSPLCVFVVGATPVLSWDRLTPLVMWDSFLQRASRRDQCGTASPCFSEPKHGTQDSTTPGASNASLIATSATTRTLGLVAARDIAVSILSVLQVPPPIQMTGAPINGHLEPSGAAVRAVLSHIDRITSLDQRVSAPFFWTLGFTGAGVALAGIGLLVTGRLRKRALRTAVLYGLRVFASWPLALLLATLFQPASAGTYLGWIGLLCLTVGLIPSAAAIAMLTSAVILVDGLCGSHMVAESLLSGYAMAGIRFYGIGNEYMGVLIGGGLLAPVVFRSRAAGWLLPWFVGLTFVLSFPAFGAKAGGAVTAVATFLFAWWELRGVRIDLSRMVGAIACGFALVFVSVLLARWMGLTPTHIDTAAKALVGGRFGYIIGVAFRKIGLALRVGMHPGTLLGIAGLTLLSFLLQTLLGERLCAYWKDHPIDAAVAAAGLRGCVVAVLFNDSGIVAAILLFVTLFVPVLCGLIAEPAADAVVSV